MKEIEVSIVIPIYNVEKYVRKTIESVQSQDFDAYEIILVDDGSKDCSGNICDEYAAKDSRITVIHQPNGGVMSARFAGVDLAKGRYIAFLDGDDRMPSSAISNMYEAIEKENADIVKGACQDIDEKGNILSVLIPPGHEGVINGNDNYREWLTNNIGGMNIRMYKKSILIQEPRIRIDRKIKNNEDYIFNILLASRINKAVFIPDLVAQIVQHDDSVSHRKYETSYWLFLLEWLSNNYSKYGTFFKDYMRFKLRIIFLNLLLEQANVDYNTEVFSDVKTTSYSTYYGMKYNLTLFAIKNPYKAVLSLFKFRPRQLMKGLKFNF